jgi:hydroxymethylpyrimidine pyrophosphatase-like HAD family hydrolase
MGRPFAAELLRISRTIDWIDKVDVSELSTFFSHAQGTPLITIGAGGSFTSAEMARLLFETHGGIAISHTPLSFLQNNSDLRNANVLLFTAAGNNRDIIAAYNAALEREANEIFVVCGATKSRIQRCASTSPRTHFFTRSLPSGRDGYLATNSLVAFSALAMRAFGHALPNRRLIEKVIVGFDWDWQRHPEKFVSPFYLAIFADWGRPAAVDLESKFSEAGLGAIIIADYRNFAHGRHNWIDKRGAESTVMAFITPSSAHLARKTLRLLPASTRVVELATEKEGPTGALELILQVFRFTALIGGQQKIDPGRPGVPRYGSRIYHLGPTLSKGALRVSYNEVENVAVNRKQVARGTIGSKEDEARIRFALATYTKLLQETTFGALVADFDGTVVGAGMVDGPLDSAVIAFFTKLIDHDVPIYFATGRGDSIHRILEASFAKKLWNRLFVSYYNGALTLPLNESSRLAEGLPSDMMLGEVYKIFQQDALLQSSTSIADKRSQITIRVGAGASTTAAASRVRDIVDKYARGILRVVQSSHSIDIIPAKRTKLACVDFALRTLAPNRSILTMGDRGALAGNDFDLLTHPFSLSVDIVSTALDCCWNVLPPGVRNTAGLIIYGSYIRSGKNSFTVSLPKKGAK